MRLVLVRHGESTWNVGYRIQGIADPPLSPLGRRQAAALAALVRDERPDLVLSSDLRRASATAHHMGLGRPRTDARWREASAGAWTAMWPDEVPDPEGRDLWGRGEFAPPAAESWQATVERIRGAIAELQRTGAGTALVTTHGGPVRAACLVVAGLPLTGLRHVPNASVTILETGPPGRIVAYGVRVSVD